MNKDRSNYNILVVEDNPGDYTLVEDYLAEQISHPKITQLKDFNSTKSILKAQNHEFDVILLDLTLPDKSGKELIKEILEIAKETPIIVLTGFSDVDFSIQSISLGISDYLLKDDLNSSTLYKSIIYCLERRKGLLELKESEKRYSDLFHLSPQPMWVYDLETLVFLDVNDAAIKNYGYSQEEFLNLSLIDIRPKDDQNNLSQAIEFLRNNQDKTFRGSFKHLKKNGEAILVDVQTNSINYKDKKAEISIITDITERSKYISTIENQNKKLQEIAWMQSHLVRAPLARIMGIVNLLQNHNEGDLDENQMLNFLIASAEELDSMIKDISDKTIASKAIDKEKQ